MRKNLWLLPVFALSLFLLLTVSVGAEETEDLAALKITPGRTVSVALPKGGGRLYL